MAVPLYASPLQRVWHYTYLVICDRSMPKVSGVELLQTLRDKHPEFNDMPFIFLTALDDRRDKHATAYLNPAEYMTKPIDFVMLQQKIERLLKM